MEGGFTIPVFTVSDADDFDIPMLVSILQAQIEHFNQRGLSWMVNNILRCYVNSVPYRPIEGSSYIVTPKTLGDKHCTVNVQNKDKLCFLYAILAQLYPAKRDRERVTKYTEYLDTLNTQGLEFPMTIKQVPKFEDLNPNISCNIYYFDEEEKYIAPLRVTTHRNRQHHVNLILITNDNGDGHYLLISSLSRLVAHRTTDIKPSSARCVCRVTWTNQLSSNTEKCVRHFKR